MNKWWVFYKNINLIISYCALIINNLFFVNFQMREIIWKSRITNHPPVKPYPHDLFFTDWEYWIYLLYHLPVNSKTFFFKSNSSYLDDSNHKINQNNKLIIDNWIIGKKLRTIIITLFLLEQLNIFLTILAAAILPGPRYLKMAAPNVITSHVQALFKTIPHFQTSSSLLHPDSCDWTIFYDLSYFKIIFSANCAKYNPNLLFYMIK